MAGNNLSLKAGTVCATCNNPDPCLHTINISGFDKKTHIWPEENNIHLKLLDSGKGVSGTILVEGKCSDEHCPESKLVSENEEIKILASAPTPVTLYYKQRSAQAESDVTVNPIWHYINDLTLPGDAIGTPKHYDLVIDSCTGKAIHSKIDVYPTVELRATLGFSYELKGEERSIKERRDEQIAARKKMEDVKPKNGAKLRNGWTLNTDQFKITEQRSVTVDYGLKISNNDFSHKFAEITRNTKKFKSLEQISKIDKFVSNIRNHLLPDPDAKDSRKYRTLSMNVEPINMGVSYAYQRLSDIDATHYIGYYASPFLALKLKIDLIQLIATYCKVDSIANKCRTYLAEGGNSLECYLQLTTSLHIVLGAAYKEDVWSFSAGKENKFAVGLEGVVSLSFKTKVLFVEVALKASAALKTEIGMKLDQHENGIDLVGYHDGIVAEVALAADVKKRGEFDPSIEIKDKSGYKHKIVLAAPLKESESKMRINLFGKERIISERQISRAQPWAMGYNSKSEM